MNDTIEKNEYSMAGWFAIAAAVLTLPMFGLSLTVDIVAKKAPGIAMMVLLPYVVVTVCHTAFSIYAFIRFRTLLNRRHAFHEVDALVTAIVTGVIVMTVTALPIKVLNTLGLIGMPLIIAFVAFIFIFALTMGVLSMIFAVKLLHLDHDLNGYLKPYAYITIAAAACFALVITAPLGMIIDAVGNVVLALIFLKPEAEAAQPEFV